MALSKPSLCEAANAIDILKIVSNLPSGWKVVGLTELDQNKGLGATLVPNSSAQNLVEKVGEQRKSIEDSVDNQGANQNVSTAISNIGPPIISVNRQSPSLRDSCSLQASAVPDFSITPLPVVKTECREENTDLSPYDKDGKNGHDSDDFSVRAQIDHPLLMKSENEENFVIPVPASVPESPAPSVLNKQALNSIIPASDMLLPVGCESKWTVVGVTTLPQTEDAKSVAQAQSFAITEPSTSSSVLHSDESMIKSTQQSPTVLNIPSCPFQSSNFSGLTSPEKTNGHSPAHFSMLNADSHLMNWTVVGITSTLTSTSTPYLMAPQSGFGGTITTSSLVQENMSMNSIQSIPQRTFDRSTNAQPKLDLIKTKVTDEYKSTEAYHQNGAFLSPFQVLSTDPNIDTQNHVPNEWRVVGMSPIGASSSSFSSLSKSEPKSSQNFSPFTFSTNLTTSTTLTTEAPSMVAPYDQPQISTRNAPSFGSEPTDLSTHVQQPKVVMPLSPQVCDSSLIMSSGLPLSEDTAMTSSEAQSDRKYSLPLHSRDPVLSTLASGSLESVQSAPLDEAHGCQWKVVGVFTNDKVSMLPQDKHCSDNDLAVSPPAGPWIASSKCESDFDKKHPLGLNCTLRAKDLLKKTDASKVKKNTVFNLLKIKRYQTSETDHVDASNQDFPDQEYIHSPPDDIPHKRCRVQPARSSSKRQSLYSPPSDEARSGVSSLKNSSDSEVANHCAEDEMDSNQVLKKERISSFDSLLDGMENKKCELSDSSVVQSPVRRRKLKVPRKMVADVDYHPFDSSSDSS
ncbi:hypothetical protein PoB_001229000 [Plakobranchus ocellatus]|uniref:Uncharacterized protein n=1 Tax=Plakobranchus ocellatus TaxID=259542 RepID=A0AAV3YSM1_9GAST|nr:hypothetical protein PoB_001229000 [Plakobranchus ocellatus]